MSVQQLLQPPICIFANGLAYWKTSGVKRRSLYITSVTVAAFYSKVKGIPSRGLPPTAADLIFQTHHL